MITVEDGNTDVDAIRKAIDEAKKCTDKPTMIKISTLIGYGSPNKVNSYAAHGAPLGADETKLTREQLKWEYGEFEVRWCSLLVHIAMRHSAATYVPRTIQPTQSCEPRRPHLLRKSHTAGTRVTEQGSFCRCRRR